MELLLQRLLVFFLMVSSMLPADLQSLSTTLAALQSGYYRNNQQHAA